MSNSYFVKTEAFGWKFHLSFKCGSYFFVTVLNFSGEISLIPLSEHNSLEFIFVNFIECDGF